MRRTRLKEWLTRPQVIQLNWSEILMSLSFVCFWLGYFLGALIQHLRA
jgi:hypothetical protein